MFWNDKEIERLKEKIEEMQDVIQRLGARPEYPPSINERIADLEIKMTRLWNLLTETSPMTQKTKLSRFGRMFGGKSKGFESQ